MCGRRSRDGPSFLTVPLEYSHHLFVGGKTPMSKVVQTAFNGSAVLVGENVRIRKLPLDGKQHAYGFFLRLLGQVSTRSRISFRACAAMLHV